MVRFVKKSTNQEVVTQNVGETKKNCKDNKSTKNSPKASQGVENIKTESEKKSCTARIQHWPFCVVIFTCWPTIYNPAFQSLFLIWNGLLELELDLESKI